jgi:hypothetical protein
MRRLVLPVSNRVNEDAGAVAVLVAVLIVVLLGFGALVIDVGNGFWERRMLQNAADAAAIAAAQDYAAGNNGSAEETARDFADDNNLRGANVDEFLPNLAASEVTVITRTGTIGAGGMLRSFLAGVIGHDEYFARAQATAMWGAAGPGANAFPIIISYCEWEDLVGDPNNPSFPTPVKTIYLLDPNNNTGECTGPSGHQAPGGWGWLDPDSGQCTAYIDEFGWVDGNTGSTSPSPADATGCTQAFFEGLIGQTVLLPIFEEDNDLPGNNHQFKVLGFAAFAITGYRIRGNWTGGTVPCDNPERCFSGSFTNYYQLGDQPPVQPGMNLGALEVYLIR